MASMVKKGINSFKFFMAYKGALMVGDELLLDGLQRCKELGALAMVNIQLSIVPAALFLSGVLYSNISYPGGMPQCRIVGAFATRYSLHSVLHISTGYKTCWVLHAMKYLLTVVTCRYTACRLIQRPM